MAILCNIVLIMSTAGYYWIIKNEIKLPKCSFECVYISCKKRKAIYIDTIDQ